MVGIECISIHISMIMLHWIDPLDNVMTLMMFVKDIVNFHNLMKKAVEVNLDID